jgi:hypothetical protein
MFFKKELAELELLVCKTRIAAHKPSTAFGRNQKAFKRNKV